MSKLKKFPHEGVRTQLLASKANKGKVGVFAVLPIRKGTTPFPGEDNTLNWVSEKALKALDLPKAYYKMYDRFGALEGDRRYAPPNFNSVEMSWYIADGRKKANLWYDEGENRFYAMRDIKPGEELTSDYSELD